MCDWFNAGRWLQALLPALTYATGVSVSEQCMNDVMHAGGANYSVPVPGAPDSEAKSNPLAGFEDDLSRTIVDCEVNADQWTLMHRYNKATELLEQALNVSPS